MGDTGASDRDARPHPRLKTHAGKSSLTEAYGSDKCRCSIKTDPAKYKAAVAGFGAAVEKIAATGSPALQSAAKTFVTDLEAGVAANDLDVAKFSADADRMDVAACTPKGAPATGDGSSAGLQDPALLGVGGAAALAGLAVTGLTLRRRSRAVADQG